MSFRLSKPSLIEGRREWGIFLAAAFALFALTLSWNYLRYREFVSHKKIEIDADVLLQYTKSREGRSYEVLKLAGEDGTVFYTTSREPIKNLRGRRVSMLLFPKRVPFFDWLSTPYIPSYVLAVLPERSARMRLFEQIAAQHDDARMRELYGALFLALPISKELRREVTKLGVNHLLALSGFHMAFLWALVYGGLSLLYRPLQNRWFPWRHRLLDVGAVALVLLGGYLWLTGSPPSLLRAYAMLAVGWAAVLFGLELFSFSFLAVCAVALVALFPSLLFSIGFALSVWGVFSIYLFLRWSEGWPKWAVFTLLNLYVYVAMLPVVHLFFGTFSLPQLLSPLLTALFALFYPLQMALHALGWGGVFDGAVVALLEWAGRQPSAEFFTPPGFAALYVALSLFAVFRPVALYLQTGAGLLFLVYLIQQVA